jgi:hypothetical protein
MWVVESRDVNFDGNEACSNGHPICRYCFMTLIADDVNLKELFIHDRTTELEYHPYNMAYPESSLVKGYVQCPTCQVPMTIPTDYNTIRGV